MHLDEIQNFLDRCIRTGSAGVGQPESKIEVVAFDGNEETGRGRALNLARRGQNHPRTHLMSHGMEPELLLYGNNPDLLRDGTQMGVHKHNDLIIRDDGSNLRNQLMNSDRIKILVQFVQPILIRLKFPDPHSPSQGIDHIKPRSVITTIDITETNDESGLFHR